MQLLQTSIVMLGIIQALSLLQVINSKVACTADFATQRPSQRQATPNIGFDVLKEGVKTGRELVAGLGSGQFGSSRPGQCAQEFRLEPGSCKEALTRPIY